MATDLTSNVLAENSINPSYLANSYPPPNESPTLCNAKRLVRQWLQTSRLGRHLLNQGLFLEVVQVSGGITNLLFRVTAPPGEALSASVQDYLAQLPSNEEKGLGKQFDRDEHVMSFLHNGVGVRFFGCTKPEIVDRKREAAMLNYLSMQGLCKRVFFRFEGGQIDEWRLGRAITLSEMQDVDVSTSVASRLAQLHSLRIPPDCQQQYAEEFVKDSSQTWAQIWRWFDLLREIQASGVAPELLNEFDIDTYRALALRTRMENASFKSPMVLCHNDLLNGNIVRVELEADAEAKKLEIEFIDYEYAGVGERGFDIANHILEMAGFGCDYSLLPGPDFEVQFLATYLQSLEEGNGEDETRIPPSSEESSEDSELTVQREPSGNVKTKASTILPEIQSFKVTSHFFWCLWALVQAVQWRHSEQAPCDYYAYHQLRLAQLTPLLHSPASTTVPDVSPGA
eukprot:Protomagalhaensia_sp_Gyna_25__48@NODE_1021_length_2281_cov_79_095897_g784_i1_p1_GENE_NODE_1021_length_2281_cov_79_095897_g784_i1NODE_1021_length_2281_cov_79_095897_g784_i1_p1_ORF_typecomplete_len455_score59_87Choline_kinase/PF01633_20/1_8e40APH/PF01636_23/1_5e11APH/PF01636_23/1_5e03DUF1679/PF07914_11/4_2e03DUF1679/PF07914_11/8_2e06EcKinase/PF02958_20/9_1e06_NODE_1021_length_2281_cov_79_095897_g784_i17722136